VFQEGTSETLETRSDKPIVDFGNGYVGGLGQLPLLILRWVPDEPDSPCEYNIQPDACNAIRNMKRAACVVMWLQPRYYRAARCMFAP
jgi:hypothetical protein